MEPIPVINQPSTTTAVGGKIHVRLTQGFYQNLRRLVSGSLLFLYFALVWIQVDGQPWLLFDFGQHRIFLFGTEFSWSDLPLMAGLMIAGTALLFFMAVGWGRLWCGFACPQSIWTWLFIRIEQITEGRASVRRKNEQKPLQGSILGRRILKHLLWAVLAFVTALSFTGYFVPIRELVADMAALELSIYSLFWIIMMASLTYVNGGLVREKVCFHMCPYSRFQGVMFDRDTRTVTYDAVRGEPRNHRSHKDDGTKAGDCVDCGLCVQVCPTGIDIRNGLQYECIDCGACIDACDAVMEKTGREKGLIAFRSENQVLKQASPLWRPRLLTYMLVMLVAAGSVLWGFTQRTEILVEIRRDRLQLVQELDDGTVCNLYRVKVESFTGTTDAIKVDVNADFEVAVNGLSEVNPSELNQWLPYRICANTTDLNGNQPMQFALNNSNGSAVKDTVFMTRVLR